MKPVYEEEMRGTQAVLFDLDGTLVDSMWMWKSIDIEYLARFGITYQEGLQDRIEGMSFSETAVYFKEHFRIPDSVEKMKDDWNQMAYEKYCHEVPLKEGAYAFLKELKSRNIKVGIATSNSRELVSAVVRALDIADLIDVIVTGCDVKAGKPSPDVYLEAARRLQVQPERCLVFEDIIPGILAGKRAGMRVIAVEDAYSLKTEEEKEREADYHIRDYRELF